jgi:hypothetical protein
MLKIAYIYHVNNRYSYAAKSVAEGFKNAFEFKGDHFKAIDSDKLSKRFSLEKMRLVNFEPDIIFAAMTDLPHIPIKFLKNAKLVLWGMFYKPCDYEKQIDNLTADQKKLLVKYSLTNDILVWSQHDDEINNTFFSGYEKELGLKFTTLLHCADHTQYIEPVLQPDYDFLWIGNTWHRMDTYQAFIEPLKAKYSNYLEYTEKNLITPGEIHAKKLYQQSYFAPNIHTKAQIDHQILVNERVFSASMMGGFQICDNILAKEYFNADELLVAESKDDFFDHINTFQKEPEKRLEMIKKMQAKILKEHTYRNRIDQILKALN